MKNTILLISQVFYPDPAAVGQYMWDVSREMVKRGWTVSVFAADRGYDDPRIKYSNRDNLAGISIRRFHFSSFGKRTIAIRVLAGFSFIFQCIIFSLFTGPLSKILVTTSPPMGVLAAVIIGKLRKIPVHYWVMDINPDQIVAIGQARESSATVMIFNWFNRIILNRVDSIITLDQMMAKRIRQKSIKAKKIFIIPPWPLQVELIIMNHKDNPFRKIFGLNKFVIMYSGNHSIANPIDTLVQAALKMKGCQDLLFMFIGGGLNKRVIDETILLEKPSNIKSLPYQPLSETNYSLAAADLHVVTIGEKMSGVVHPSKIYGAIAVGRPILVIGPVNCIASKIVKKYRIGWQHEHGDIEGVINTISMIRKMPTDELEEIGRRSHDLTKNIFCRQKLLDKFCNIIKYIP